MKLKRKRLSIDLGIDHIRTIWSIKPFRLALLGILLIPLIYSSIYLAAFYDPYKQMNNLPVAVVNLDQGAVINHKKVQLGDEFCEELRKKKNLKWKFVTYEQMRLGFFRGDYALGIVIPQDFSQQAISITSSEPLKSKLHYYVDQSHNYLAGSLGKSMIQELDKNLSSSLTTMYAKGIFTQIQNATQQLQTAANGAKTLTMKQKEAQSATAQLKKGVQQLKQGEKQLINGTTKLSQGAQQFTQALHKLRVGSQQVATGVETINSKMKSYQQLFHRINQQVQRLASQPLPSKETLAHIDKGIRLVQNHDQQAYQQLQNIAQNHPEIAASSEWKNAMNDLRQSLQQQEQIDHQHLQQSMSQIQNLTVYKKRLATQAQAFSNQIDQQMKQIEQLQSGAQQVADGIETLEQKGNQWTTGIQKLQQGQKKLLTGLQQLHSGLDQLHTGLGKLSTADHRLANGLNKGVNQAKEQLQNHSAKEQVMAHPIQIKQMELHKVPNYATGFAPYFLSLSLWVGAMLLFTVLDLYQVTNRLQGKPLSLSAISLIAIFQSLICTSFLQIVLDIQPKLWLWFYLFPMIMAVTFVVINQFLVNLFGNVGRFLAIILLMLQLASSAGTYPLELLPLFFQAAHPYLPMSYTVHGLRIILSNGESNLLFHDVAMILLFLIMTRLLDYGWRQLRHRGYPLWIKLRRG